VSPDGRWLAYVSDETGTFEVYVRPFRRPGGRTKVSAGGGRNPVWSPTSAEILFGVFTPNQSQIMVTSYSTEGESFLVDKPRVWAGGRFQSRGPNRMFDIFPDGTRLAMAPVIQPEDSSRRDHVTFIFNFFEELRRAASK
jgi:serine/threonine-protein kinase